MAASKKGLMPRDVGPPAQPRLSPEEMMRATEEAAPELPPTRLAARQTEAPPPPQFRPAEPPSREVTGAFAFRMRTSTLASLARVAHGKHMTQKQIVCMGLRAMGVDVAEADLEDRSPRRRQQFLDT